MKLNNRENIIMITIAYNQHLLSQASPVRPSLAVQLVTAGTAACVADLFTFPLDTAKVRLQVQGES